MIKTVFVAECHFVDSVTSEVRDEWNDFDTLEEAKQYISQRFLNADKSGKGLSSAQIIEQERSYNRDVPGSYEVIRERIYVPEEGGNWFDQGWIDHM